MIYTSNSSNHPTHTLYTPQHDRYQPCSMAESAARDVTFAIQSGELKKMIRATGSNVSLAGFTVVVRFIIKTLFF